MNRFGNEKPKHAPVDTWCLDKNGNITFAQLKRNTKIPTHEMLDLVEFAMDMKSTAKVQLVNRVKRKIIVWEFTNESY